MVLIDEQDATDDPAGPTRFQSGKGARGDLAVDDQGSLSQWGRTNQSLSPTRFLLISQGQYGEATRELSDSYPLLIHVS